MSSSSPVRAKPHRRVKPGYKSPSTIKHSKSRRRIFNNLETLTEFYGMDTNEVQFALQDFYYKFKEISQNGESIWEEVKLDKKHIVWLNPNNGFSIAALNDLEIEIGLPDKLPTFKENLDLFKTLWMNLDHNLELLYENIETHHKNQEYCCMDCHATFATVCSELYTKFERDPF